MLSPYQIIFCHRLSAAECWEWRDIYIRIYAIISQFHTGWALFLLSLRVQSELILSARTVKDICRMNYFDFIVIIEKETSKKCCETRSKNGSHASQQLNLSSATRRLIQIFPYLAYVLVCFQRCETFNNHNYKLFSYIFHSFYNCQVSALSYTRWWCSFIVYHVVSIACSKSWRRKHRETFHLLHTFRCNYNYRDRRQDNMIQFETQFRDQRN